VLKVKFLIITFIVAVSTAVTAHHLKGHSIEQRIKPAGSVYVEGDDVPVAKPAVVETAGPRSGEDIYKATCATCHATDAIGAPMFGNADAWKDRIAKGESELIHNAIMITSIFCTLMLSKKTIETSLLLVELIYFVKTH